MEYMIEKHFVWSGYIGGKEAKGIFSIVVRTDLIDKKFCICVLNGPALPASALVFAEQYLRELLGELPAPDMPWTIEPKVSNYLSANYMVREKQDRWTPDGMFKISDRPIVAKINISSEWTLNHGVSMKVKYLEALNHMIFLNQYNELMRSSTEFEATEQKIFGNDITWNMP